MIFKIKRFSDYSNLLGSDFPRSPEFEFFGNPTKEQKKSISSCKFEECVKAIMEYEGKWIKGSFNDFLEGLQVTGVSCSDKNNDYIQFTIKRNSKLFKAYYNNPYWDVYFYNGRPYEVNSGD